MTIFTIDSENHIAAHGSASEITDKGSEQFTSEKELAHLAADWPSSRLVDIWNRMPGLTPVKRFTSRASDSSDLEGCPKPRLGRTHGRRRVCPAPVRPEAHAQATRAHRPKEHQAGPSCGPAETLGRRHTDQPHARNRLAGAQRSRLHLWSTRQTAETQDRIFQELTRRASLSYRVNDPRSQPIAPEAHAPALCRCETMRRFRAARPMLQLQSVVTRANRAKKQIRTPRSGPASEPAAQPRIAANSAAGPIVHGYRAARLFPMSGTGFAPECQGPDSADS